MLAHLSDHSAKYHPDNIDNCVTFITIMKPAYEYGVDPKSPSQGTHYRKKVKNESTEP
jgi:hypothetical protein